jgi:hypothetical protein
VADDPQHKRGGQLIDERLHRSYDQLDPTNL